MKSILEGVRVLDFGRYIAAPLCGSMLAELGADVIRIEPPQGADDRFLMAITNGGEGASFLHCNRGKRSLTLDTSQSVGREAMNRLVAQADVVLVSFPPAALKKMGLDYAALSAIKQDIIVTAVSAYDSTGPDANRGGFDGVGQSMSGAMQLTGFGERPTRSAVSYVDYATGMSCAYATLAALINRMKTGEGSLVESSLLNTAMNMMAPIYMEEATGTRSRTATGNRSPIAGPSDLFATSDGWVLIQVIGEGMFRRWATLVDRPDLLGDPRFGTDQLRGDNGDVLSEIMAQWCSARTTEQCLAELDTARVPAGKILSPGQVIDPANGLLENYFEQVEYPQCDTPLPMPGVSARVSTSDRAPTPRAPLLGEHSGEVLLEFGFTNDEVAELVDAGIASV